MIIAGSGTASAADALVGAFAAETFIILGPEGLEQFTVLPDLVERQLTDITGFFDHVGARFDFTVGSDDAVSQTGKTAAGESGIKFYADLLGDPGELRTAGRLDGDGTSLLLGHDISEELFVFHGFDGRAFDLDTSSDRNEEEDICGHSTHLDGKVDDIEDLRLVPIQHSGMDLESKTCFLAVPHALDGLLESVLHDTELVMLLFIKAVETDAHSHGTGSLEFLGNIKSEESAVGTEYRTETAGRGMCHELIDIGAHQCFTAGEDHHLESGACDLIDESLTLFSRELIFKISAGILITVLALEITAISRQPRN